MWQGRALIRGVKLKALDYLVLALALGITISSFIYAYTGAGSELQVIIEGQNDSWIFPLDAEETIQVSGFLGSTVVRIHDNEAWVLSSPCANQSCVTAGRIHSHGQWVACMPNGVFLRIEGKKDKDEPDGITW